MKITKAEIEELLKMLLRSKDENSAKMEKVFMTVYRKLKSAIDESLGGLYRGLVELHKANTEFLVANRIENRPEGKWLRQRLAEIAECLCAAPLL